MRPRFQFQRSVPLYPMGSSAIDMPSGLKSKAPSSCTVLILATSVATLPEYALPPMQLVAASTLISTNLMECRDRDGSETPIARGQQN
jgi:hypothetical protein